MSLFLHLLNKAIAQLVNQGMPTKIINTKWMANQIMWMAVAVVFILYIISCQWQTKSCRQTFVRASLLHKLQQICKPTKCKCEYLLRSQGQMQQCPCFTKLEYLAQTVPPEWIYTQKALGCLNPQALYEVLQNILLFIRILRHCFSW
jgi:hypothetical protein